MWYVSKSIVVRDRHVPTRHFADPFIAVAALGASPESLLRDMSTFGLLFESLCIRDLRVYARALKGEALHYHDESGLEADAVISLRDGRYALVEVKMGAGGIEEGAISLLKLAGKVDSGIMAHPRSAPSLFPEGTRTVAPTACSWFP